MKRSVRPEETRLWSVVTATVRPSAGRKAPVLAPLEMAAPPEPAPVVKPPPKFAGKVRAAPPAPSPPPVAAAKAKGPAPAPGSIEPGRKRRITRERDPLDVRLDLHGLDQDAARRVLHAFLVRAQAEGVRAVLVITGKGSLGDGVLRRRTPDWLAEPALRPVVAGVSEAHRRHGGEGALYVALKRKA